MKLTHIDGVPITKPCTPHDRGYIKGWEARQGEIDKLKSTLEEARRRFERMGKAHHEIDYVLAPTGKE